MDKTAFKSKIDKTLEEVYKVNDTWKEKWNKEFDNTAEITEISAHDGTYDSFRYTVDRAPHIQEFLDSFDYSSRPQRQLYPGSIGHFIKFRNEKGTILYINRDSIKAFKDYLIFFTDGTTVEVLESLEEIIENLGDDYGV